MSGQDGRGVPRQWDGLVWGLDRCGAWEEGEPLMTLSFGLSRRLVMSVSDKTATPLGSWRCQSVHPLESGLPGPVQDGATEKRVCSALLSSFSSRDLRSAVPV